MVHVEDLTIEPAPLALIGAPLDWFLAEHQRHRQFCRLLTEAASAHAFDGPQLAALAGFVRHDLAQHIVDEEDDLFPLLRRRARSEDEIEAALSRLSAEHGADAATAQVVLAHLDSCLEGRTAPATSTGAREAFEAFASAELRHLALENAVVLPIARMRLSKADLHALGRRLAARRGIALEATGS